MLMKSIGDAVNGLIESQVPVLCLDTCDFADVVRGIAEGNLFHAQSFLQMRDILDLDTRRFQPLITYLVRHEWDQNRPGIRRVVEQFLVQTANSILKVADARRIGGLPVSPMDLGLFDASLAQNLVELAEDVMDRAVVLERDDSCVARALERVMSQQRPSHKNQIKDSIHWEHYLELSRRLMAAGHSRDLRVFVSANKADFWANRDTPQIHPDLEAEAQAAGLRFFGRLDEALRELGL